MHYKTASYDLRLFGLALTPSIFSGIFCVVVGLLFVGSIVFDVLLKGSFLPIVFFDWSNLAVSEAGDTTYGIVLEDITNKMSAFAVWALFGLFIVVVAGSIYEVIHNTKQLRSELTDQRLNHKKIALEALERFGVHALTFVLWAVYAWVFFKFIVIYIIAASATGAVDLPALEGIGYIILATLVSVISLHAHIVFLRVLLLKPRVFGSANQIIVSQGE